jgi:hypothetical protein
LIHDFCLTALRDSITAHELWASAVETGDQLALDNAVGYQTDAVSGLRNSAALVQTL